MLGLCTLALVTVTEGDNRKCQEDSLRVAMSTSTGGTVLLDETLFSLHSIFLATQSSILNITF